MKPRSKKLKIIFAIFLAVAFNSLNYALASTCSQAATTVNYSGSFLLSTPRHLFGLAQERLAEPPGSQGLEESPMIALMDNWGATGTKAQKVEYLIKGDYRVSKASIFLSTLASHKKTLMEIYSLNNDTYNKLAAMAFGIMGVETKLGINLRYKFKENNQWLISLLKAVKNKQSANSRGLTQIKVIPQEIARNYPEITPSSLTSPVEAAIATLGYLAEALNTIRRLKSNQLKEGIKPGHVSLAYITEENIFDFLPYIYSGRAKRLFLGPQDPKGATVIDSLYIKEMILFMKRIFFLEEVPN